MGSITAKQVVTDILEQHAYRSDPITCAARDWTHDGENDFTEHQAEHVVSALWSAGFIEQTRIWP